MTDVEIGLGAVLGDEHLAVLERAHRAGIDVEIRIELLRLDAQAARLQQPSERSGDDPLAESRDDAARDEDVLRWAGRRAHVRPSRSIQERTGARSIQAPMEVRSPRMVRPARAPIATHWPLPVNRFTELKPSMAPSAFDPASPSIAISRRSYGSSRTATPTGASSGKAANR